VTREDLVADVSVDARNVPSPVPILKAAEALKQLEVGQSIELLTNGERAARDVPAWAADMGYVITERFQENGTAHFVIAKT
jgi:TusA-related sulfurtransferase